MTDTVAIYYSNYTPVGDILVIAACLVFAILFRTAYIPRSRAFLIFRNTLILLVLAAFSDILYNTAASLVGAIPNVTIYITRIIYHLCIFGIFTGHIHYVKELMHLNRKSYNIYLYLASAVLVIILLYDILGTVTKTAYYINEAGEIRFGLNLIPVFFICYLTILFYMIIKYRTRIYKQIVVGVASTSMVSLIIACIQELLGQYSFTVATFLFPSFAILYLIHSNPYDTEIGAVNITAFEDLIAYSYAHRNELLIMSLYMRDFDVKGTKFPKDMQNTIRYYNHHFFKGALLFQISGGHIILVADTAKNPDYDARLKEMVGDFVLQHAKFRYDYKIVILRTLDEISANNDYIGLIHYLEENMHEQEFKYVNEKDIENYRKHRYIISELEDINSKRDLLDKRVEVFCQPVLNIGS